MYVQCDAERTHQTSKAPGRNRHCSAAELMYGCMQIGTGMVLCCDEQQLELGQSQDSSTANNNYARTDLGNITTGQQPYCDT